jgi:predicted transcriptional regulator
MKSHATLKARMLRNPEVRREYDRLGPEFEIVNTLIEARTRAGLTQAEVAERMGTTQSVVARMEGGRTIPNLRSLHRYAEATGQRLKLTMERASG